MFILLFFICSQLYPMLMQSNTIAPQEVDQLPREWEGNFHSKRGKISFFYNHGKVGLRILKDEKEEIYGEVPPLESKETTIPAPYFLAKPRIADGTPRAITEEKLIQLLSTKKVLFYTGAGISVASGVAAMDQLMKNLSLDKECELKPAESLASFKAFCDAAYTNPPTTAHRALYEITEKLNCAVVTENFDFLHQRAGTKPLFAGMITDHDTKGIDILLCLCLSHDDRGLIARYKKQRPDGMLIALNLEKPKYIGSEDFLLIGDIQEILPRLKLSLDSSRTF